MVPHVPSRKDPGFPTRPSPRLGPAFATPPLLSRFGGVLHVRQTPSAIDQMSRSVAGSASRRTQEGFANAALVGTMMGGLTHTR